MPCARCNRPFDAASLRPIGAILTTLSAPLHLSTIGSAVSESARGLYCPACRRQMRLVFAVLGFVGGMMVIGTVLQLVGVLKPLPKDGVVVERVDAR